MPVMKAVREAELAVLASRDGPAALPADGRRCRLPQRRAALLFGADSAALVAGRIATIQTVGGSAARSRSAPTS
jgi:aromatic-amino-acid transaminase